MTAIIPLPWSFTASRLFATVGHQIWDRPALPDRVVFDFSGLGFVRPCGIVFLSNLTRFLEQSGCTVVYEGAQPHSAAISFMDDARFFEQHTGNPLSAASRPRLTTLPLLAIRRTEALPWVDMTLIPWLSGATGIHENNLTELGVCVKELFNNIADHTGIEVGSIFAQWYPNLREVVLSVADFGRGIPTTVRQISPDLSDEAAIICAFEDGFTSKSQPHNQGVGLHYLKLNVVQNLNGSLEVHSGTGSVFIQKTGETVRFDPYYTRGFCPGTLINITFRTDLIDTTPAEEEAFTW